MGWWDSHGAREISKSRNVGGNQKIEQPPQSADVIIFIYICTYIYYYIILYNFPTPTHSRNSKLIQPPTQLLGHPEPHSPVQHRATTGPRSEFTAWLLVHPHCLLFANYPPYFLAASIPNSIGSSCNSMKSQNSIPPNQICQFPSPQDSVFPQNHQKKTSKHCQESSKKRQKSAQNPLDFLVLFFQAPWLSSSFRPPWAHPLAISVRPPRSGQQGPSSPGSPGDGWSKEI